MRPLSAARVRVIELVLGLLIVVVLVTVSP
jgi:hypothetical protein